jgi:hypothetical protein
MMYLDERKTMLRTDHYEKFYPREYLVEELCVIEEISGPYLQIRWFVEDPDPGVDWYLTDVGSSPKIRLEHEGKLYMANSVCWVGIN